MPRSKSGKKRDKVDAEKLTQAVEECINGGIAIREAVRRYGVSKTTLIRHIRGFKNSEAERFTYSAKNNVKQVFSKNEEESLKTYLVTAARLHYGLTRVEVRKLAYQFASAKEKRYPDIWNERKIAGKEWLRQFMTRHTDLSLRKPEATSLARSTAFNRVNVTTFFDNYKSVLSRGTFSAEQIWNIDETGITTVHVPPKIISPKGVKQVGQMTSGERGQNITLIAAINALGNAIPPMMIFPRVHFKAHMLKGGPIGSIGGANSSGWSNSDLFYEFMQHFANHVKPSVGKPIIILLDNHDSHISIPTIDFCKANGIILVTFHPHTSHKFQPLDRTVFGPLKAYYNTACNEWMLMHPGQTITIYDIAELVGKAFPQAFTPLNIQKGFEVSGLYPFNENIFQEHEFLTSYVTDRPRPSTVTESGPLDSIGDSLPSTSSNTPLAASASSSDTPLAASDSISDTPLAVSASSSNRPLAASASTSDTPLAAHASSSGTPLVVSASTITPEILRPFPKAPMRKKTGGRPRGKSRILTDTPEKEELERKRDLKAAKKVTKNLSITKRRKVSQNEKKKRTGFF